MRKEAHQLLSKRHQNVALSLRHSEFADEAQFWAQTHHPAGTCALLFTTIPGNLNILFVCLFFCFCVHELTLLLNDACQWRPSLFPVGSQFKTHICNWKLAATAVISGSSWVFESSGNFCSIRGSLAPPCGEATNLLSSTYHLNDIEYNICRDICVF